jgi:hypothetical protein
VQTRAAASAGGRTARRSLLHRVPVELERGECKLVLRCAEREPHSMWTLAQRKAAPLLCQQIHWPRSRDPASPKAPFAECCRGHSSGRTLSTALAR